MKKKKKKKKKEIKEKKVMKMIMWMKEERRKKVREEKKEDLEREIVAGSKLWNVFKSGQFDNCLEKICEQFDVDSASVVCKEKMIEELMRKIFSCD